MRLFKRISHAVAACAVALSTVVLGSTSVAHAQAPVLQNIPLNVINNTITLIFQTSVGSPLPDNSMFVVKANGVAIPVVSLSVVGTILNVNVTPGAITQGMTVTFSYVAPAPDNTSANAALQDTAGRDAASMTDLAVTNLQPPPPPTTTTTTTTVAPTPMATQSVSWDSDPATEAETDANTVGYMPLSPGNIIITDQVGFVLDAKNGVKPKIRMKSYAGLIKMKIASSYKVAGKTVKYSCKFAPFGTSKKSTKVAWKWYSPKKACILPAALLASVRNGSSTLTATASWPRIWLATGKKVRPDGSKIAARKLTYTIRNRP
jgi:hypothetical protein